MSEPPAPTQRVSAIPFPDHYDPPTRPDGAPASIQDAYRETTFVLGADLRLFTEGMGLQLGIVRDASASAFRRHPYAALMGLWSRTFLALTDVCLLATRGSYGSCPALARSACEYVAAQHQLSAGEMPQFQEWLGAHLAANEEHKAFDVGLGRYFAGETLAADARLRSVYRVASELARPNFGATLFAVGPESNNLRLAITFADASFHLAWAELVLGWLLALSERQIAVAVHAKDVFGAVDNTHRAYATFARRVDEALARVDRCRIEEVDDRGFTRYLIHNVRRQPGGSPKRLLL